MKSKMNFHTVKFSKDVIAYRSQANLNLRDAATESGISRASLSRIENGYVPDLITFVTVCKWMGCQQMDVYFFEDLPFIQ